jgi:sulfur carrier protein
MTPSDASTIQVTLNGEPRPCPAGSTLADLLAAAGHAGRRVAIERNGEIVPRSRHAETTLADGDRVEIVQAIGGG